MDQRKLIQVQIFAHSLSLQVSHICIMIKQTKKKIKPEKMAILERVFLFSLMNSQGRK